MVAGAATTDDGYGVADGACVLGGGYEVGVREGKGGGREREREMLGFRVVEREPELRVFFSKKKKMEEDDVRGGVKLSKKTHFRVRIENGWRKKIGIMYNKNYLERFIHLGGFIQTELLTLGVKVNK